MMRWVVGVVSLWLCLGLCSCGTELTTAGAGVRVGQASPAGLQCSELDIIYSTEQEDLEKAENELRNQTAARGGNFVVMDALVGNEQRLRALDELHKKGLITDAEYQQRRKEIIESI